MQGDRKPHRPIVDLMMLWSGWVLGPTAWALHLMVSYLLVEWVCRTGHYWALHGVTLATFALALAGADLSWRQWRAAGYTWPTYSADSRPRFLAVVGLLVSVLSGLIILAEGIPNFVLDACL